MKINKFKGFNTLIFMFSILIILFAIIGIFSYKQPSNTKSVTGIVTDFNQRDKKWYDFIFGGSRNEYFNINLNDDQFFTATGIAYDNIDRALFTELSIGEEITIVYNDEGIIAPNKLYNIKYKDKNYLDIDDLLKELELNEKIMKRTGLIIILVTVIISFCLYIWNYKKNRLKK